MELMEVPPKACEELSNLSLYERWLVMEGLYGKLLHYHRTGDVSFSYSRCPVCRHIGATSENHDEACQRCPVTTACQYPFTAGFRDDTQVSLFYFEAMLRFLLTHKPPTKIPGGALVVGGTWGDRSVRSTSGVASKLAFSLDADLANGGPIDLLPQLRTMSYGLIVWMPDVDNEEEKFYPAKQVGSVLIVSKVMREGVTHADAAKRIFMMKGNAVLQIRKVDSHFSFRLADALNNVVFHGHDIHLLADDIRAFTEWSNGQIRVGTIQLPFEPGMDIGEMKRLLLLVRALSERVEARLQERYFGNVSTRCVKLFPSTQAGIGAWVSGRNIDKRFIELEHMVWTWQPAMHQKLLYRGEVKPSVDAPIQLELYRRHSWLHYMIHGHASVRDAPETGAYYPCGDLREVRGIHEVLSNGHRIVNLRNHGFLFAAETLDEMERLIVGAEIVNRL